MVVPNLHRIMCSGSSNLRLRDQITDLEEELLNAPHQTEAGWQVMDEMMAEISNLKAEIARLTETLHNATQACYTGCFTTACRASRKPRWLKLPAVTGRLYSPSQAAWRQDALMLRQSGMGRG